MVRGDGAKEAVMKLRLDNLWGRPRGRESIEQEANEELARVSGGGGQAAERGEPAITSVNGETSPVAGSGGGMPEPEAATEPEAAAEPEATSELETAAPEPEAAMDDPRDDAGPDGIRDWEERMAEVRQGRR
jgi:hypothetical protein